MGRPAPRATHRFYAFQDQKRLDFHAFRRETRSRWEAWRNTMGGTETDKVFSGSIPKLYETYLVPLIFEPYAADLAHRLAFASRRACSNWPLARVSSPANWHPYSRNKRPSSRRI